MNELGSISGESQGATPRKVAERHFLWHPRSGQAQILAVVSISLICITAFVGSVGSAHASKPPPPPSCPTPYSSSITVNSVSETGTTFTVEYVVSPAISGTSTFTWGTSQGSYPNTALSNAPDNNELTATVSSLAAGTTYYYHISAAGSCKDSSGTHTYPGSYASSVTTLSSIALTIYIFQSDGSVVINGFSYSNGAVATVAIGTTLSLSCSVGSSSFTSNSLTFAKWFGWGGWSVGSANACSTTIDTAVAAGTGGVLVMELAAGVFSPSTWGGYLAGNGPDDIWEADGQFAIPSTSWYNLNTTPAYTGQEAVSIWVGIGGFDKSANPDYPAETLWQAGVYVYYSGPGAQALIFPFVELVPIANLEGVEYGTTCWLPTGYPSSVLNVCNTVYTTSLKPAVGDTIEVRVWVNPYTCASGACGGFWMYDQTQGASVSGNAWPLYLAQSEAPGQHTAEWIEEAPGVPMPVVSTVTFSSEAVNISSTGDNNYWDNGGAAVSVSVGTFNFEGTDYVLTPGGLNTGVGGSFQVIYSY